MKEVSFWGFDRTLAARPGPWSGSLLETLNELDPGHGVTRDDLIPHLQDTFPWHHPDIAHPELCEAARWWRHTERILARAYRGAGYPEARAAELAERAHVRYLDVGGWRLVDDTLRVLRRLHATGWRHIIASNYVPESATIVREPGLG